MNAKLKKIKILLNPPTNHPHIDVKILKRMLFVLPSSKKQSRVKLIGSSSVGVEVYPFQELTSRRVELINCFDLRMDELSPVWRRFKNNFWDSLEFWVLPPQVQSFISDNSLVLSPLLGLISINSPVPYAVLSWEDKCKGEKLRKLWKRELKAISEKIFSGKTVISLVGKKEESLLSFKTASQVVKFEFYRKGEKIVNPQRHRAYVLRYIGERNLSLDDFSRINFYDYKVKALERRDKVFRVIFEGEGEYI